MNNVTYLYDRVTPDKSNSIFQLYFNAGLIDEDGFILIPGTRLYIQALNHGFHSFPILDPSGQRLPTKIEAEELIKKNLDYIIATANAFGWYEFHTAINFSYRFWTSTQDCLSNAYCFYLEHSGIDLSNQGSYAWTLYVKEKL